MNGKADLTALQLRCREVDFTKSRYELKQLVQYCSIGLTRLPSPVSTALKLTPEFLSFQVFWLRQSELGLDRVRFVSRRDR